MYVENKILIGKGDKPVYLLPDMANRHGLIAGATGTGKTATLKVLAESFSDMGVPVFLSDIKGDLASLAESGTNDSKLQERLKNLNIEDFPFNSFPIQFWDIFGECGIQVRTTISEMGSMLVSRILGLNETQESILSIAFRIADERGLLLLDLKDLRAIIQYIGENSKEFTLTYGNISQQSIGAILRRLLVLEDQGGNHFFGEPNLDILDWMKIDENGRGYINILHCIKLFNTPRLYSTFLLWMLSELFEALPEAGDLEKPKIVFFFDEAHALFDDAPKVLLQKIEQVVRLIRSKGVGVYFVTQNPMDLPSDVLNQLGNRIQHGLRAYTPSEIRAVQAAADSFRTNSTFSTSKALTELATGEALISCLDSDGRPSVVERVLVIPPQSRFGTIDKSLRNHIIVSSPLSNKYSHFVDRESAYEILQARSIHKESKDSYKSASPSSGKSYKRQTPMEKAANAAMSTIGREIGKTLVRGILGSLKR